MRIHLIGIGGIGVSALAQYYLSKGYKVSGSDLVASEITDFLKKQGIKVFIGNSAENIHPHTKRDDAVGENTKEDGSRSGVGVNKDFDLVVYSPAVKRNNPELLQAIHYKLQTKSYPEALGDLTKEYYTIAVAGAHGKSTTASMIALVLTKAGLDPTVIVGTKIKEFSAKGGSAFGGGNNFRAGKSKILVIEACEYDSSFLYYWPNIIVITNVDKEHLDYFKTFTNVKKAFKNFVLKLPADGFLVFNEDDKNISKVNKPKFKTIGFSVKQKEAGKIKNILKVPGLHNVSNALAVLQVARILGIPDKISFKALSEFKGTWRRFEVKTAELRGLQRGKTRKITIISDYAHHPNEISATLEAAREKYPKNPSTSSGRRIWCIFQPHQHQRTYYLFNDFVKVFRLAPIDKIIITDIYDVAGREIPTSSRTRDKIGAKIKEVSSEKLVEKINRKNVSYCATKDIEKEIKESIKSGDILIIMGAGDIYKLADKF